ncbi:beta propeller domain-containing protein [Burkholderiales bacterium JOSHI_001]|nr:beta propeller domain-containing protein [Burkholderiales bacterium JOSHI_001]
MRTLHPLHLPARLWPAALLTVLAACGGGGGSPSAGNAGTPLLAVAQPGELLALARQRLAAVDPGPTNNAGLGGAPMLALAGDASGSAATVLRSSTLVQEAGIDEADLLKSTDSHVYTLDGNGTTTATPSLRVRSHRLQADGGVLPQGSLLVDEDAGGSVTLHGLLPAPAAQRLAVLSEWMSHSPFPNECLAMADCLVPAVLPAMLITRSEVHLAVLRAPDDGSLTVHERLAIQGRLVGSRLVGQQLVLVTTHSPSLPLAPGASAAERQAALARLSAADILPTLRVGAQAVQALVADTDCYLQTAGSANTPGLQITTITVLDLGSPSLARRSRCFVGEVDAMYLSAQNLYLATSRAVTLNEGGALRYTGTLVTDIHKFTLAGLDWRGSGQVDGHLGWDPARKAYRMSEHDGLLRVLSFTGDTGWTALEDATRRPASPATLTVLREAPTGTALERMATLPNASRPALLGHAGEQVHGVRFIGTRAYLVTFRRTDPLYVLDLADPADPRAVGELQVPGFSDHLFDLGHGLLLGTGHDADANGQQGGLRFGLFDVSNPAQPQALGSVVIGERGSASTLDHTPHGLALRADGDQVRLAVPVVKAAASFSSFSPALLQLNVDTTARTLSAKPLLASTAPGALSLWDQRVMHSNDKLLHWVGGDLRTLGW